MKTCIHPVVEWCGGNTYRTRPCKHPAKNGDYCWSHTPPCAPWPVAA